MNPQEGAMLVVVPHCHLTAHLLPLLHLCSLPPNILVQLTHPFFCPLSIPSLYLRVVRFRSHVCHTDHPNALMYLTKPRNLSLSFLEIGTWYVGARYSFDHLL